MAGRKSGGKCTCKSITVIVKMRASLSSNRSEKTYFPPLFDTIIANLHCQILMVIFLSLRAKFTCYQQIKTHTSKYFLVNVWNDFWKCDINFGFNYVFSLRWTEFKAQVPVHETLASITSNGALFLVRAMIFLDNFPKLRKVNICFVIYGRMEHHLQRTDFLKNFYFNNFRKSVENIRVSLQS